MRKEYMCDLCNFKTNFQKNLRIHNTTKKHQKNVYESKEYRCELCYYSTSLYQNFQKHLETQSRFR